MTDRIPVAWIVWVAALSVSLPGLAQTSPPVGGDKKAAEANKAGDAPLSAEERIRRATVPPPGKACPPDPAEAERAALDARRAKNLNFVSVSNQTVESAEKISAEEWARRRAKLQSESLEDWNAWVGSQRNARMVWQDLPPCGPSDFRRPGSAGKGDGAQPGAGFGSLIRHVLGPDSRKAAPKPRCICPPGAKGCLGEPATRGPRQLAQFMLGLPAGEAVPLQAEKREFYSSVRAELMPSGRGTELLLASASNVPVVCIVDMLVEREGKELVRQSFVFDGPGSTGGIVKEAELGLGPHAYDDELVVNAACVPRYVWSGGKDPDIPQ